MSKTRNYQDYSTSVFTTPVKNERDTRASSKTTRCDLILIIFPNLELKEQFQKES